MSIFRCIDRRFETGEIFIKWDESNDDEWLILIYIKDNSPEGKIIIEDSLPILEMPPIQLSTLLASALSFSALSAVASISLAITVLAPLLVINFS